jgi:transcriptional regulator with XRE-family HTH domain
MKNKVLRNRIKAICKEKGLSMEDLSGQLGIGKIALSQSLSRDMRISRLYEIADVLGVGVGELFSDSRITVEIDGKEYPVKENITIKINRNEN